MDTLTIAHEYGDTCSQWIKPEDAGRVTYGHGGDVAAYCGCGVKLVAPEYPCEVTEFVQEHRDCEREWGWYL